MTDRPILHAARERAMAALRVIGSFVAALGLGSLVLLPLIGPIAMIVPFGAAILGFPSLVVAIALRIVFHRSIPARLLAWCLAAPFLAAAILLASQYLLDYRLRGFDVASFLAFDHIRRQAGLALFHASLAAAIFYAWEKRSVGRAHASS